MSKVYNKKSVVGHTQEYIGLTQPRKEEQDVEEEKKEFSTRMRNVVHMIF
jgi:hypothetical protein